LYTLALTLPHLKEQSNLFNKYIKAIPKVNDRISIITTGYRLWIIGISHQNNNALYSY